MMLNFVDFDEFLIQLYIIVIFNLSTYFFLPSELVLILTEEKKETDISPVSK